MKTVKVSASRSYEVHIGSKILENAAEYIEKALSGHPRLAIITDDKVDSLHGDALSRALSSFDTVKFVFKNGEGSKNIETYGRILNFLAENRISGADAIVAFGGGVVGDMAGFAASTYLRGIPFLQIPTTLLAMVDSSVGGKTAIDLPAGKNLCGTFWQPSLVLCDPELLSTLPDSVFSDGMAEVIKYGVLRDSRLFDAIVEKSIKDDPEDVICRCIEIKRDIVNVDERDTGIRALLNLGHTAAHAIEKLSDYSVSHGRAVGIGMVIAARGAEALGLTSADTAEQIKKALKAYGLTDACDMAPEELAAAALSDKKRKGESITLVLPKRIGECMLYKMPASDLPIFFQKGMDN